MMEPMGAGQRRNIVTDPDQRQWAGRVVVVFLMFVAYLFRQALATEAVLDTDVMNFGLSAFRFDLLAHQPHPPGYPGYVVFLKLIHALAPGLGPIEVARWGALLCGLLLIPSTYWACRQILGGGADAPVGRPLAACAFSMLHPILWFYGGDGQSHAGEALLTVLLFGATAWTVRGDSARWRLALVVAFGLSGSVRPTIAALSFPLLLWAYWRRPLWEWVAAFFIGVASVVAWYVPLAIASGGQEMLSRATKALVSDLFVNNYSIFGDNGRFRHVVLNMLVAAVGTGLACVPLFALTAWRAPWIRALLALAVANFAFYALVYTAESGYLSGVAGVMCLIPAAWPSSIGWLTRVRGAAVAVGCFAFVWFAPPGINLFWHASTALPTYRNVLMVDRNMVLNRNYVCETARGRKTLLITDNPVTTHNRWIPMVCPNITLAMHLHDFYLNAAIDNWMVFTDRDMHSIPPPVPLEPGPPTRHVLDPVEVVLLAPDLRKMFGEEQTWGPQLIAQAKCPGKRIDWDPTGTEWEGDPFYEEFMTEHYILEWPAHCFDEIRIGSHTMVVTSL